MPFLFGLLHAFLFFLAFEPVGAWPLAIAAPIPLLLAARKPVTWKGALLFGLGAAPFYAVHHWFIGDITAAGMPPLVAYMSLWPAVTLWLTARLTPKLTSTFPRLPAWLLAPVLWVGIEMLRGEVLFEGYAWYTVGLPMVNSPFGGLAPELGVYGVSFHVVLTAALVLAVLAARRFGPHAIALAVVLLGYFNHIPFTPSSTGSRPVRIAVVQTNVPQSNKLAWNPETAINDFTRLIALTLAASKSSPDLIIWPETMKPGWVLTDAQIAETEALLAKYPQMGGLRDYIAYGNLTRQTTERLGVSVLVGQETVDGFDFDERDGKYRSRYAARYNSAYLVTKGVVAPEVYHKLEPTPFGENIPWINAWPWLKNKMLDFAAGGMKIDLASGTERTVFRVPMPEGEPLRIVTPICFESTDTDLCRSLAYEHGAPRADLLVCMTNDGWFGNDDWGRRHHLQMARWRCLELGIPMARAANTGLSAFIDERGRVLESALPGLTEAIAPLTAHRDGVVFGTLRTSQHGTLYGRIGNVTGWASLIGLALALILSMVAGPTPDRTRAPARQEQV